MNADAAAVGCQFHQGVIDYADTAGSDPALECHKCVLYLAVGGALQITSPFLILALPIRSATESSPERHFYRFVPDSFSRPPITLIS